MDFSSVVIQDMEARYAAEKGIDWKVMDVRDMSDFQTGEFEAAIDKGTIDSMVQGSLFRPSEVVRRNIKAYLAEVSTDLSLEQTFLSKPEISWWDRLNYSLN